jgi:hypothetical protein
MSPLAPTSGSAEFDLLREAVHSDRQLRNDIENLMLLIVETYNPTDRGVRFITGGIGEWLLALAAYSAGVLSMPAGHNADGFDLRGVLSQSKALWSAKGSNRSGGEFIISNGRNGPGSGLVQPTVFWSPDLPGLVFVSPSRHPDVVNAQRQLKDSTVLSKSAVSDHAASRPECVIDLHVPENPGTASIDPAFEALKVLISGGQFPRLRRMLDDARRVDNSLVAQLQELRRMKNAGDLTADQYDAAVNRLTDKP